MASHLEAAFDGAFRERSSTRTNQAKQKQPDASTKASSLTGDAVQTSSVMHRVLMEYDPLLLKANEYPLVTRYIGGRVLSFFTLSMVLCSIALIVLTSLIYTEYTPASESLRDTYLSDGASVSYVSVVEAFLSNITGAQVLTNNEVPYSQIFSLVPGIISIVKVVNSTTPYYVRALWSVDRSKVNVVSNQPDCAVSPNYNCDTEVLSSDIRNTAWYTEGSSLEAGAYLWSAPNPFINSTTGSVSNSIDLIWKTNTIDGVTYTQNVISVETQFFLTFSENRLLDHFGGTERVWLVHGETEQIIGGLNVFPSQFVVANSTESGVVLKAETLTNISSSIYNGAWVRDVLAWSVVSDYQLYKGNPVSSVVRTVPNSPYSLVVASDASNFDNESISALSLAAVLVAILPLLATSVMLASYWLKMLAIERKKHRRREEVSEAALAMESVKMRKLAEIEALRSKSKRLMQSKTVQRITEAGARMS